MGTIAFPTVFLASLAFFAVGAVWYGVVFGWPWLRPTQATESPSRGRLTTILALTFAFEMLVVLMLAHNVARTNPAPHVIMMMAVGFALTIMTPAIGIAYLQQRAPLKLFLIDAGHFLVGMAAAGGVMTALR